MPWAIEKSTGQSIETIVEQKGSHSGIAILVSVQTDRPLCPEKQLHHTQPSLHLTVIAERFNVGIVVSTESAAGVNQHSEQLVHPRTVLANELQRVFCRLFRHFLQNRKAYFLLQEVSTGDGGRGQGPADSPNIRYSLPEMSPRNKK